MHLSTAAFNRGLRIGALLPAVMASGCATHNTIRDGDDRKLMLKGHDPVSYFTIGGPAPGNPAITAEHDGVTYRFMNEENRALFVKNPDKYKPQYNGYCANGVVSAIALGGNHDTFRIINGRLFIFGGAHSRKYVEMDQQRNLQLADGYWRGEMQGSPARLQSWKRLLFKVPHYQSNKELAEVWDARQAKP
jgi:YHS domain-containing protein